MAATMTFFSTAILTAKTTAYLALIASRCLQAVLQERFMIKWWLSTEAEAWNFTKNKFLKLVTSMKADISYAGLNLNTIVQKKTPEKYTFIGWCFRNKGH